MSISRPFARNTGNPLVGTAQYGDLVVGLQPQLRYDEYYGGLQWWNGADEELGYVIGTDVPAENHPTPVGNVGSVRFWRTTAFTDNDFIFVASRVTSQSFTGATQAYSWLTNNGYWTSYKPATPVSYEIVDGKFIRQEYSPVSDTIWTTAYVTGQLDVFDGPSFDSSSAVNIGIGDAIGDLIYGPNINRVFGSAINLARLQMYNPSDNSVVTTLTVGEAGNNRRDMAYNLNDSTVWMIVPSADKVYVVSATTTSLTEITGITLTNFGNAQSITWNSEKNLMYVGGNREIDIVDCDTRTKIGEINNIGEEGYSILLDNMVYDPVHDRVYFSMSQNVGTGLKIYYLDCETNTITSVLDTTRALGSSTTSLEYDPNGYVWSGKGDAFFVIDTETNTVVKTENLTGLSTDIIFKSSQNQMICARGSTLNAVIYDVTSVY
jgi:hypothetical protein